MHVGKNGKSKIVNDMDELSSYAGCDGWPQVLGRFWGHLDWVNYKTLNTKLFGVKE